MDLKTNSETTNSEIESIRLFAKKSWAFKFVVAELLVKGQIISKRFFLAEDSRRILVKTNSFVRFLEESLPWQFAFEINWPLYHVKSLGEQVQPNNMCE